MSKRVLVTGASGSIGNSCVLRLVRQGWQVLALSRRRQPSNEMVRWLEYDLLELDAGFAEILRDFSPSHLLHLAWDTTRNIYWTSPSNLTWSRVSTHLLEMCIQAGVRRAVGVGTCAEYAPGHADCDEHKTPLGGVSPYAHCKVATCKAFEAAHTMFPEGTSWARLFFPFGPLDHPDKIFPYAITTLSRGQHASLTSGEQVRDFLYVEDVASALERLLDSKLIGPINIASGTGRSIREVMTELAAYLQRVELLKFGTRSLRSEESDRWVASVTRLREELGWRPAYSLMEGIQATADFLTTASK